MEVRGRRWLALAGLGLMLSWRTGYHLELQHTTNHNRIVIEEREGFKKINCSDWSKLQVPSLRFGPKRNPKMPFDHHPHQTFERVLDLGGSSYLICRLFYVKEFTFPFQTNTPYFTISLTEEGTRILEGYQAYLE